MIPNQPRPSIFKEILLRLFFQLLPTMAVATYLLWNANLHLSLLRSQYIMQSIFFGMGMFLSLLLYTTRIRFLPSFGLLLLLGWTIKILLNKTATGDVDMFFITHQFTVYFFILSFGWVVSFGLRRIRFGAVAVSLLFVGLSIYLCARLTSLYASGIWGYWLAVFIPVTVYGIYLIFITEQLRDYNRFGGQHTLIILRNTILFLLLCFAVTSGVIFLFRNTIEKTFETYTKGKASQQSSGMLEKKENGYSIRNSTDMSKSNGRSNELLMAAYIDNFFPDSDIPNPLYLTAFYYAQFDSTTETFERVYDMPDKDLFAPDPSTIPLYFTVVDSTVLEFAAGSNAMKTVEIEVYNKGLSSNDFVAPSTAYFIQPIAVDKDFQNEYKSAYRAKSRVSDLNSAYFVYNANLPEVKHFQNERYRVLRNVSDFRDMDPEAYRYYTYIPAMQSLDAVKQLAFKTAGDKTLPIDRIIAIKDYFLSKDANGKPLFTYSDNPGIPDIPSASKLNYFLFENRKGYCAHYAGATLFMLRSLGIPSRITAGFLTEDRSTNNKGWYFFYADQVHAWVQVYFPGYGWLDFDTTVGNDEARESDQPDGTPPLQPSKASLAINGVVTGVDTNKKQVHITALEGLFKDKNYAHAASVHLPLDVSIARIIRDTSAILLSQVQNGDTVTAISFDDSLLQVTPNPYNIKVLADKLPKPLPVDQLQLRTKQNKVIAPAAIDKPRPFNHLLLWSLIIPTILLLTALYVLFPSILMRYYISKAKSPVSKEKGYYQYIASSYYLWMFKEERKQQTPLSFASTIDEKYDTDYTSFIKAYLKMKYSNESLSAPEMESIDGFTERLVGRVSAVVPIGKRRKYWLHTFRALRFVFKKKNT